MQCGPQVGLYNVTHDVEVTGGRHTMLPGDSQAMGEAALSSGQSWLYNVAQDVEVTGGSHIR